MTTALEEYLKRVGGVVSSRMRGPKARRGTKWWTGPAGVEVKAVDPKAVFPAKLVEGLDDAIRPVVTRVVRDAAKDTADRLGAKPEDVTLEGLFAVDEQALSDLIEAAIADLLGAAERHAREVRQAVQDADGDAGDLDAVLDRIEEAHRRGGGWLKIYGRDLAHALSNRAALDQARALGVRTTQWLSRRDDRVRRTHVIADGQVRPVDEKFTVGRWKLLHPGDPADMPDSGEEIHGCRCTLLFDRPDKQIRDALNLITGRLDKAEAAVDRLLKQAPRTAAVPLPSGIPAGTVSGVPHAVTTTEPLLAYRLLDDALSVSPGQRLLVPSAIVLGLAAAEATAGTVALIVAIPAGTALVVVGGSVVLAQGTPLEVLAAGPNGVEARPVA